MMKNNFLKIGLSFCLLLVLSTLMANDAEASQVAEQIALLDWAMENIIFILGGFIVLGAFVGIVRLNSQLLELQKIRLLEEHGIETMEKLKLTPQESFWDRFVKNQTKAVAVEHEEDVMLDHDYDGIKELDNILPPWWVSLFNISIVIAVVYFGYYHMTDYGQSSIEQWETEIADAKVAVKNYLATQANLVDESTVVALTDPSDLAEGKKIFMDNNRCAICHGANAQGVSAPNLTDEYWLHGGGIKNVFTTIKYGVPEKGMISWKTQLGAGDIQKVASYVLSLAGTNPETLRKPEGEIWEDTTTPEEASE